MRTLAAFAVVVFSTLALHAQSAPPNATPADTITREELRQHVYFLASDFLGGRRPDDSGYTIAAEYAASDAPALPEESSSTLCMPRFFRYVISVVMPRSLKEPVGIMNSSFIVTATPSSLPQTSGVQPSPSVTASLASTSNALA